MIRDQIRRRGVPIVAVITVVAFAPPGGPPVGRGAPSVARAADAEGDSIAALVGQLGADDFAQREAASRSLAAAGMAALGPLEAAIAGDDLEVASRAAEIVRGFLAMPLESPAPGPRDAAPAPAAGPGADQPDRSELSAAAERLLCRVSERPDGPLAGFAVAALDFHHRGMSQESRERLEALGAVISEDFSPLTGQRGLHVKLGTDWKGSADDVRLVPRLRQVVQVSVLGVRLDDSAAAALARVRGVERFELYGTGITDPAIELLRSRFPESRIDIRKGGKLGVGGQPSIGPCMLTQVLAGSAADKAGLQISDIVLAIDGTPVPNFESLTDKVGRHGPGETLVLDVQRNAPGGRAERFTARVVLDGWD